MALIQIGSLAIQLNRKAIQNLHISVLPPNGKIRVSAPNHMSDTAIRMAVISRIPWIRKQQRDFAEQPRQSEREYVNGETHYLWGSRFRLELVERAGKHEVRIKGKTKIQLFVSPETTLEKKAAVFNEWYRAELKSALPELLTRWQTKLKVKPKEWGVKKMKTKWGSCNIEAKRIWLNLELAKKPVECLEYILVHELVHLLERHHNDRFVKYMDKFMPKWREHRNLLNRLPLAHEDWQY